MVKRRDILKAGLAILAALPFVKLEVGAAAAPLQSRSFDDQEPYGFQPPHRKCKKYEKIK